MADGISDNTTEDEMLNQLRQEQGWSPLANTAQNIRAMQATIRSIQGISMTMALSRAMLFIEYLYSLSKLSSALSCCLQA